MSNFSFVNGDNGFESTSLETDDNREFWYHFERSDENFEAIRSLGLTIIDTESLLDETTRPHFYQINEHCFMLFLRGVNLNPDSEPEDMVSLRFWFDGRRLVTVTNRTVQAISHVSDKVESNSQAFSSTCGLFEELISQILIRIERHVVKLSEKMEQLEESNEELQSFKQSELHDLRRAASRLRRFMHPQLEAIKKLALSTPIWLDKKMKRTFKDFVGSMMYYNEEISLVKERCEILGNEVSGQLTARVNRNLYIISIITVIFLPLSFVTGLLGINVGGIPAASSSDGFFYVSVTMFILLVIQLLLLKLFRWF